MGPVRKARITVAPARRIGMTDAEELNYEFHRLQAVQQVFFRLINRELMNIQQRASSNRHFQQGRAQFAGALVPRGMRLITVLQRSLPSTLTAI